MDKFDALKHDPPSVISKYEELPASGNIFTEDGTAELSLPDKINAPDTFAPT
jgi:hypothetical protein